jgi:hypothetical protein
MRITRKILEKKLEILKGISKGKFAKATLDYYGIGGGYRIDNADGYSLGNYRLGAGELARALDMLICGITIINEP